MLLGKIAFAQVKSNFPFLSGEQNATLFYIEGDSVLGKVKLNELPSFIYLKKSDENKYQKIHVSKLQGLKIDTLVFKSLKYRPDELSSKNTSLVLVKEKGKINLYQYFSIKNIGREQEFFTTYILQKDGVKMNDLSSTSFISFKSGIEQFVRDYPDLFNKIKNDEEGYNKKDIEYIIATYNANFLMSIEDKEFEEELNRRLELEKERIKQEMLNKKP